MKHHRIIKLSWIKRLALWHVHLVETWPIAGLSSTVLNLRFSNPRGNDLLTGINGRDVGMNVRRNNGSHFKVLALGNIENGYSSEP